MFKDIEEMPHQSGDRIMGQKFKTEKLEKLTIKFNSEEWNCGEIEWTFSFCAIPISCMKEMVEELVDDSHLIVETLELAEDYEDLDREAVVLQMHHNINWAVMEVSDMNNMFV